MRSCATRAWHCGRKRVARLMRQAGLEGVHRRRFTITTRPRRGAELAPDLVNRGFHADEPNRLWVSDITYVPSDEGFLYVATVLDVVSRRVVGWSMSDRLHTEVVLQALDMAVASRRPLGDVTLHSDHGCQYTSLAFGRRCRAAGIEVSMGTVGDAYDNAMAESYFASLECELIDRTRFRTREEARREVFLTSRASTTPGGCTRRWATCRRRSSSGEPRRQLPHELWPSSSS